MRGPLAVAAGLVTTALVAASLTIAQETTRAEARLRPGDLAPDLRAVVPSGLYVVDDRDAGGTLRLKFTTVIWNAGEGPMEIRGSSDPDDGEVRVRQIVHRADGGTRVAGAVGTFDFEHRHGHVHLSSFARYELWTLDDGVPVTLVAINPKVGFCLMDNLTVDATRAAAEPVYDQGCDATRQGISPGWGDQYVAQLYEQDLVIEGLPDGPYRLVNVANPEGVLAEADHDNNAAFLDVELRGGTVSVLDADVPASRVAAASP
jgi:hypothetical protein